MATDYGEKEREFIDGLEEATGRDLQAWMDAISAQNLSHRNDIIDWLRQQGFMFSKASWLERIHHNGGKPIYAGIASGTARTRRPRQAHPPRAIASPPEPEPSAATATVAERLPPAEPASASSVAAMDPVLAKAKAYRPLAVALITRIKAARPSAHFEPSGTSIAISDPGLFAQLGIGAKELRLHLALGDHAHDEPLKKGAPGGGLGKGETLSHMLVLTDARQIDQRLIDLVHLAAAKVNG